MEYADLGCLSDIIEKFQKLPETLVSSYTK